MLAAVNFTLVDDLLARRYENITVLDISQTAIDANRERLGRASERVHWLVADITKAELQPSAYDVWHDRAVFHFLTSAQSRILYVRKVVQAVKPGGHVIVSTFVSSPEITRASSLLILGLCGCEYHLCWHSDCVTPLETSQGNANGFIDLAPHVCGDCSYQ